VSQWKTSQRLTEVTLGEALRGSVFNACLERPTLGR
jgi:hypothetical protein